MIWRLAWRSLLRNPRRTGVIVTAVAVGIAGCFLTIALNLGMAVEMVDTAIASGVGHVQIHAPGYEDDPDLRRVLPDGAAREMEALAETPRVRASARRVRGEGLVSSPRASVGVQVMAVEPQRERQVSNLAGSLVAGQWLSDARHRVVIGAELAHQLRVGVHGKIVLSVQDADGDLTGEAYRVAGLFQTSSREVNQRTVLLRLDEAQALFRLGHGVSEVVAVADARRDVGRVRAALAGELGGFAEVRSWEQIAPLLVYLLDLMNEMAWIIYAGVFIAMAFGIANVLLMSVYERTREIGVMMAMGMSPRRVVAAVVVEAMLVTGIGLTLGMALGWLAVSALKSGIPLGAAGRGLDAFGIPSRIVPVLRSQDVRAPLLTALAASVVASAWPALRASALRPSEALRRV